MSQTSREPIRVLCVDDVQDVLEVMRLMIDAEPDMEYVGGLATADQLVEEARRLQPDIVLLDASMPGKDPFAAIGELRADAPDVAAILYTGHDELQILDRAVEAGAWGCVAKTDHPEAIVRAVRQVAAGNPWFAAAGRDEPPITEPGRGPASPRDPAA